MSKMEKRNSKIGTLAGCGKSSLAVILSGAKDLHLLVFKEILQMLSAAQHDRLPVSAACWSGNQADAVSRFKSG